MLQEVGQEVYVEGRYYSGECPEDMLQFSKAIGTPDDIAKKNCGASLLSFFRDYSVPDGWISSWKIGDPPVEYRTPFVIGKPFTRTKNEKSEQVVYDLKPIQPSDSVVSLVASYTGINHDLCYSFEYVFVAEGLLVTSIAKDVTIRRWFKRLSGMPPPDS